MHVFTYFLMMSEYYIHSLSYHYNVSMGRLQSYHSVVIKNSTCSRTTQYCHQDQYVFMYSCMLSLGAVRVHVYFSFVTRSSTFHEYLHAVTRSSTYSWISICCHQELYVFMTISMLSPGAIRVHGYLYAATGSNTCSWISIMLSPGAVRVYEYPYVVTSSNTCSWISLCCHQD